MTRRILLNFRIDQDIAREILPSVFRPRLCQRYAIGGICLIQFGDLDGNFLPIWMGPGTNTASYRFAVTWEQDGETRFGNYVPRRESNSFLYRSLGDKAFPPVFNRSCFRMSEEGGRVHLRVEGIDDGSEIEFHGQQVEEMTSNSVFGCVEDAVEFFSKNTLSYFPNYTDALFYGRETTGTYHGVELRIPEWSLQPMKIEMIASSFVDNRRIFPPGSIEIDSAFIMRNVAHTWIDQPDLCAGADPMRFCDLRAFKSLSLS